VSAAVFVISIFPVSTDQTNGRPMTDEPTRDANDPHAETAEPAAAEPSSPPDAEAAGAEATEAEAVDEDGQDRPEEVERLREELEALKEERDELNDRLLRKAAELDNYRRRMDREKKRRREAGKVTVLEAMLEVLDDFERSLDAARDLDDADDPEAAYESLKGGVEMVFQKFQDQLESLGVEPIEAQGKPFDEQLHEAMMRQPSADAEPGTVLEEVQKGYTMGDRVIRHSRVVVAAEPSDDSTN
jgi:molecular chaperone GrpE